MKSQPTAEGHETLRPSSEAKRRAIMAAAEQAFLAARYESVTMDEIAATSGVSKQTIYAHFGTKDQLFVALVTSMTRQAGDDIHRDLPPIDAPEQVAPALEGLLAEQLAIVLHPRLLRLRRLVIGEVTRFPELARAVLEHGPRRAVADLAALLTDLDSRGLVAAPDPVRAATDLNWLVMAAPVNDAMFLGDDTAPSQTAQGAHVRAAVATFLRAYGR